MQTPTTERKCCQTEMSGHYVNRKRSQCWHSHGIFQHDLWAVAGEPIVCVATANNSSYLCLLPSFIETVTLIYMTINTPFVLLFFPSQSNLIRLRTAHCMRRRFVENVICSVWAWSKCQHLYARFFISTIDFMICWRLRFWSDMITWWCGPYIWCLVMYIYFPGNENLAFTVKHTRNRCQNRLLMWTEYWKFG